MDCYARVGLGGCRGQPHRWELSLCAVADFLENVWLPVVYGSVGKFVSVTLCNLLDDYHCIRHM